MKRSPWRLPLALVLVALGAALLPSCRTAAAVGILAIDEIFLEEDDDDWPRGC